jgi:hypothetical protein
VQGQEELLTQELHLKSSMKMAKTSQKKLSLAPPPKRIKTMNVDSDIVALIGLKEVQLHKMKQDMQGVVEQYNNMVAAWMFIDGFLKPLMELQLKAYRARLSFQ